MSELKLESVSKKFGTVTVIDEVDLVVAEGEFVVLVGPSGCGKSTLLRLIAGLEDANGGKIFIDGEDVTHAQAASRPIAMVFQSYALYPHMNVRKNLSFGLKNMKTSKAEIKRLVDNASDVLQLTDYLDRMPKNLSGGQRQRVAIGRAIVRNPKIFLFDEPLSNLDAELRVQMRHELIRLHRRLGSTMIYVTHDQVEAMTMADRIAVMRDGIIEQVGSPLELYNNPCNTFVAGFIGSPKINLFGATIETTDKNSATLVLDNGSKTTLKRDLSSLGAGAKVQVGVRPEHLTLDQEESGFSVDVEIDTVETLGDTTYVYAQMDEQEIRFKLPGQHKFKPLSIASMGTESDTTILFDGDGNALNL